jgi:hypothetical protein
MNRIIALPLQALVALAVTVGALSRPEALGSHLAGSGAPRCALGHGAAVGVVGAPTRRGEPARGEPTGVGVPRPTLVAAAEIADVHTRRCGGSVRRPPSSLGSIRPAATQSTGAKAGWRGVQFRSSSLAILLPIGVREARDGADLASATSVETAPQPTKATAPDALRGGSTRDLGLGALARAGTFAPLAGSSGGVAQNSSISGDRAVKTWRHSAGVVRTVPFLWKWAVALLPIAKGVNP